MGPEFNKLDRRVREHHNHAFFFAHMCENTDFLRFDIFQVYG